MLKLCTVPALVALSDGDDLGPLVVLCELLEEGVDDVVAVVVVPVQLVPRLGIRVRSEGADAPPLHLAVLLERTEIHLLY